MNKFFLMIAMFLVVLVSGCATHQHYPASKQPSQQQYQPEHQQQTHTTGGERTMIKPSLCEVDGQKINGLSQEECLNRSEKTKPSTLCSVGEKFQANAETNQIACLNTSTGNRRILSVSEVCSQGEKLQHNPSTKQVACFNPETNNRRFL